MYIPNLCCVLMGTLAVTGLAAPLEQDKHKDEARNLVPIETSIRTVAGATNGLNRFVANHKINLVNAIKIRFRAEGVKRKIKNGIKHANLSPNLDMPEAIKVLVASHELLGSVNDTMNTLIKKHPNFRRLPLIPKIPLPIPGIPHMDALVRKFLKKLHKRCHIFGDAVLGKVPEKARKDGQAVLDQIYEAFERAIKVFEGRNHRPKFEIAAEDAALDEVLAAMPTFQQLTVDPAFQDFLNDPAYQELIADPAFQAFLDDPEMDGDSEDE